MYQPALRPDQITRLYYLKLHRRKPMTRLLREAVDQYLQAHTEELEHLAKETEANFPTRKEGEFEPLPRKNNPRTTIRKGA